MPIVSPLCRLERSLRPAGDTAGRASEEGGAGHVSWRMSRPSAVIEQSATADNHATVLERLCTTAVVTDAGSGALSLLLTLGAADGGCPVH
jgi:hypothetical protein